MAATYTPVDGDHLIHALGDLYALVGKIVFTGSYASGGDALSFDDILKQIGLGNVYAVIVHNKAGYSFEYDYTNEKLKVLQGGATASNPQAEIGAGAYPAALTSGDAKVFVLGR